MSSLKHLLSVIPLLHWKILPFLFGAHMEPDKNHPHYTEVGPIPPVNLRPPRGHSNVSEGGGAWRRWLGLAGAIAPILVWLGSLQLNQVQTTTKLETQLEDIRENGSKGTQGAIASLVSRVSSLEANCANVMSLPPRVLRNEAIMAEQSHDIHALEDRVRALEREIYLHDGDGKNGRSR